MGEVWAAASEFLASMASTVLGKMILAAAALMIMAVAGLLGYALLKGNGDGSLGMPDLGGITDNMKIHGSDGDRLGVASNGELNFGGNNTNAAPKAEAKAEDAKADDKKAPDADKGDVPSGGAAGSGDQLAHNLSGAKLSSSLGGDFGNKNIFAGGSTPKFDISKTGMPKLPAVSKGTLSKGMSRTSGARAGNPIMGRGAKSSRAIGQLKMAKGMSVLGAGAATPEQAAAAANGAFDQQQPGAGTLNTNTGTGVVTPPGGGGTGGNTNIPGDLGGNTNDPNFNTNTPAIPPGTTVDPGIQNATNAIQQMADAARQMKQMGMMILAMGIVVFGIGVKLAMSPWPVNAFGFILMAIGAMLMGVGYMMINMAGQMAQMAKAMGSALSASLQNTPALSTAVDSCTDQALNNGTQFSQCQPSNAGTAQDHYNNMNTVGTALTQQELNSNVTLGNTNVTTH
jgi:hypothetical protein